MTARGDRLRTWSWPSLGLFALGLAVAASGVWFIAQWHSPEARSFGIERVQYDAAWAFTFAGIALALNVAGLGSIGRWFATVPVLLGGLRIVAELLPGAFGTHPILANPWLPFGAGNYNAMGMLSAALFVVLGCALIWAPSNRSRPWRSVAIALMAAVALGVGMLLLVGAWTGRMVVAQWLQLAGGERSGAVLFLLLGGGVLAQALLGGEDEQRAVRRWTPAIVGFAAFVCAAVLSHALALQQTRYIENGTRLVAAAAKLRIELAVEQRVRTLQLLAERSQIYSFTESQFQQDAKGLLENVASAPELQAIAWAGQDRRILWLAPPAPTGDSQSEIRFDPLPSGETLSSRRATITHFSSGASGERGIAIAAPAYAGDSLRGVIFGALAPDWLKGVLRDRFADFGIELVDSGKPIGRVAAGAALASSDWTQEQPVSVANAHWTLQVTPTDDYLRDNDSALPEAALTLGLVLSGLLALCTYLFQTAQRRARALARTNARLLDDIRARRQAEQALAESEQRRREQTERARDFYLSLFSGFPNLVWRSDVSGRCDYLNQAWLDLTGRTREAEVGDGWLAGLHPDDHALWHEAFGRAFPARQPFEVEFRLRRADGEYGWFICNGRPYHDQSGSFAGYLCSCYDNTARRTVEDALKESEEMLERITANIPGMVFKLERLDQGHIAFAYVNPACEAVTGLSPATLLADAGAFFDLVPAADRVHLMATLDASATQLGNWNWSGRLHPAHGSGERWVTVRAKPRRAERGTTIWDGVVVDDSQVRLTHLELERSREDLRALSRHLQSAREEEKASIAREVHDELGSTLTALRMDLDWLGTKLKGLPEEIGQKRVAMAKLVDAAVAATRKIVTDLRPSVLDDLGLAAALRWQATEFTRRGGAKVRVEASESGPAMSREIALTLFRIFQETLTNVARHAKASEVAVQLTASDGAFVLQIQDDGVGLSEKDLVKPTSHGIRGMRERARQFGGDISVSSKPGGGTTLVVTVPRGQAPT